MHLEDGSQRPLVSTKQQLPSPVTHLTIRDDLSLYELDTACRLSSVIGDMVGERSTSQYVYLHIPRPEYILVMLGHQRGRYGGGIMSDWLAAVGHRSQRVSALFKALLTTQSNVNIEIGSPLDSILMPYLHEAIESEETPSPNELADLIRCSNTEVGELFKQWLTVRKGNVDLDYYDLAQFGYVAGVAVNFADGMLTIEVDNPSEEPIFKAVSRVVRRCSEQGPTWRGNAMAVYPYEQMASWHEGPADWRRVTRTAVDGDAVEAIMLQYGIDMRQRDYVVRL